MPVEYLGSSGICGICFQKAGVIIFPVVFEAMRGEFTCTDQGAGHEALWVKGRTQ